MSEEPVLEKTPANGPTLERSRLYLLLAGAFGFPDEGFHEAVRKGELRSALAATAEGLPYPLEGPGPELADGGGSYAAFQSEYIRLFDVGAAGPPCPLYGGLYVGDRLRVMEETVRFYHYFGLRLSSALRELPDHLTTELEFLHFLTFREARARSLGEDPSPYVRAERDFLLRHPCRWIPLLEKRLEKTEPLPFFSALVSFTRSFLESDRSYCESLAGAS
ncbi:MAG: hypothetical protein KatS3mg076_1406 [Candidatus Binatia bacterium]|nr:MAG: hypothetical protein KatS3mg076_1406 [Candidatus Binatia bacterium]